MRDAFKELNNCRFPGSRPDSPAVGGVTWWFKQDEIHQATHVHDGLEFLPWHREIVNRLEEMLRQINPQLSLHYWDWTQHPMLMLIWAQGYRESWICSLKTLWGTEVLLTTPSANLGSAQDIMIRKQTLPERTFLSQEIQQTPQGTCSGMFLVHQLRMLTTMRF